MEKGSLRCRKVECGLVDNVGGTDKSLSSRYGWEEEDAEFESEHKGREILHTSGSPGFTCV
jgi:hypothetical protein